MYTFTPQVRGPYGAAGQLEGVVPHGGHDGARLRHDRRDHALLQRICARWTVSILPLYLYPIVLHITRFY